MQAYPLQTVYSNLHTTREERFIFWTRPVAASLLFRCIAGGLLGEPRTCWAWRQHHGVPGSPP